MPHEVWLTVITPCVEQVKQSRASHTELTTAIQLIVEAECFQELVAAVGEATLSPVLRPEVRVGHGRLGGKACPRDLLDALPTGGGERGGEVVQAEGLRLLGGDGQAMTEAEFTAWPAFRLILQALDAAKPRLVVVVAVNPPQSEALSVALAFFLANLVLPQWVDVGIEIEDCGADVVRHHPLYNGG